MFAEAFSYPPVDKKNIAMENPHQTCWFFAIKLVGVFHQKICRWNNLCLPKAVPMNSLKVNPYFFQQKKPLFVLDKWFPVKFRKKNNGIRFRGFDEDGIFCHVWLIFVGQWWFSCVGKYIIERSVAKHLPLQGGPASLGRFLYGVKTEPLSPRKYMGKWGSGALK